MILERFKNPLVFVVGLIFVLVLFSSVLLIEYRESNKAIQTNLTTWHADISLAIFQSDTLMINKFAQFFLVSELQAIQINSKELTLVQAPFDTINMDQCLLHHSHIISRYGRSIGSVNYCFSTSALLVNALISPFFLSGLFLGLLTYFIVVLSGMKYRVKNERLQAQVEYQSQLSQLARQVSHDIRSPISALKIIAETSQDMREAQRSLLLSTITRINGIANDLLDKTRQDQFRLDKEVCSVSVVDCLNNIVVEKKVEFSKNSDLQIEYKGLEDRFLKVVVNENDFKRALSNLINNAVEASSHKGVVSIDLQKIDHSISISIKDEGKGIPQEILNKIINDHPVTNKKQGNGLGVFTAKQLVKKWGGQFSIESQEKVGTVAKIRLPLRASKISSVKSPLSISH